jgi:MYXO-CTERM domain-containing protein
VTSPNSNYDAVFTSNNSAQFALFAPTPPASVGSANGTALTDFWLGMDDVTRANGSDLDYQDVVVEIQSLGSNQGTPEPGFYGLLAAGMLGLALFARRRQRNTAA